MTRVNSVICVAFITFTLLIVSFSSAFSNALEFTPDFQPFESSQTGNIALGKPVTVITNGANDNRESPGLYPSDITDGSLDYLPSSWAQEDGTVGYVNNDYNQPMVVTVTFQLQGTYNITSIRYNMGHVQRAETWNPDLMTTPFGTIPTNPGTPYQGAWTEHTGNVTLSSVTIILEKTRVSYPTDWLFIGEIEIYGTPAGASLPVFDLPINYPGRGNVSEQQFVSAWQSCVNSFMDHRYPFEYDGFLVPFWGTELTHAQVNNCTLRETCYDGHEGYDFDDLSRCGGSVVFPVADGTVTDVFCDRYPNPPYNYRGGGCQVRIRHGETGYETLYAHLQEDSIFSTTKEREGQQVTSDQRIGTIGCTGNCKGAHLHLDVYYEGEYVDSSGWEGDYEDPYVKDRGGPESHRLWLYSPRRSTPVNHAFGIGLVSPSGSTVVSVSPNAHYEDYVLTLTEVAPTMLPVELASGGHGFVLQAQSVSGEIIEQFATNTTVEVRFELSDIEGIQANKLSLYIWNIETGGWIALPTTVSLPSANTLGIGQNTGTATATIQQLGYLTLLGEPYLAYLPVILR